MRPPLVAGCLAATLMVAANPAPSVATSVIPAESSVELPSQASSAIVGDVDGDGVRELVRILPSRTDPAGLVAEVTTVDEVQGVASARRAPLPVSGGAARLLAWRLDGVERVIVAATGAESCCLTISEVGLEPDGVTELRLLANPQAAANSIRAVDLDGDGTDELVVTSPPDAIRPDSVLVHVLRWEGDGFSEQTRYLTPAAGSTLVPLGDSDGRPGEELGMIAVLEAGPTRTLLHRISLDDGGAPRTELGELPFLGELVAMDGAGGGRIVLTSFGAGLRLLRWPASGEISVEEEAPQRGEPIVVIGSGADARLLLRDQGGVLVVNQALEVVRTIDRSEAAAQFRNSNSLAPYVGAFPAGLPDGVSAAVFRGRLVTLADGASEAPADPIADRLTAVLPGISPIGAFGAGGAWTALAAASDFDTERQGGLLGVDVLTSPAVVNVVRTDVVLRPEEDGGTLEPAIVGAIRGDRPANRPLLLARGPFQLEVAAPPGSSLALDGGNPDVRGVLTGSGVLELAVSAPTPSGDQDERFSMRLQVVTPAGHGYAARWDVQILREPPAIAASTDAVPLSFNALLTGRTEADATVLVDGRPVAVDQDGIFTAEVSAGPVPRDVRIEVSDVVGNISRRTVSVAGFVDLRRLPGLPIVVAMTVLIGILLYLRAPRSARPTARSAGDDATFEEIE